MYIYIYYTHHITRCAYVYVRTPHWRGDGAACGGRPWDPPASRKQRSGVPAALQRRRCLMARPGHGPFPFGLGALHGNPRLVELHRLGFRDSVGNGKICQDPWNSRFVGGFQQIRATSCCSYYKVQSLCQDRNGQDL